MQSMYDTIMELPFFKGIGEDQLSQLLEKTSVEFLKFEDGERVANENDPVKTVNFLLNGRVRQSYRLKNYDLSIDEILGKGAVVGGLNLFGMDTSYQGDCVAIGKLSMMRIDKSQYLNILRSDNIYIMNFVNYLSAAAQKGPDLMLDSQSPSIRRTLEDLAFSIVSRRAETVMVAGENSEMARYCGVSDEEFEEWMVSELAHNRIITNQRGIFLKSAHLMR